jgi:hypothetical protein
VIILLTQIGFFAQNRNTVTGLRRKSYPEQDSECILDKLERLYKLLRLLVVGTIPPVIATGANLKASWGRAETGDFSKPFFSVLHRIAIRVFERVLVAEGAGLEPASA